MSNLLKASLPRPLATRVWRPLAGRHVVVSDGECFDEHDSGHERMYTESQVLALLAEKANDQDSAD